MVVRICTDVAISLNPDCRKLKSRPLIHTRLQLLAFLLCYLWTLRIRPSFTNASPFILHPHLLPLFQDSKNRLCLLPYSHTSTGQNSEPIPRVPSSLTPMFLVNSRPPFLPSSFNQVPYPFPYSSPLSVGSSSSLAPPGN